MFFYPNFVAPRDSLKLQLEISHSLHRETGTQALMKVRCSNGLQVSHYYGSFLQHSFGADLEIGSVDADKAIGVTFSYDGKLDAKLDAHFQAALLYTSATGQRRVRCINVVAGVNEGATETMRTVDQDAVVNIMAKEASSKLPEKSLKDIRLCMSEAETLGVPMIVGNAIKELLTITALRQGSDADFTTIVKSVEEWAGVEVKAKA